MIEAAVAIASVHSVIENTVRQYCKTTGRGAQEAASGKEAAGGEKGSEQLVIACDLMSHERAAGGEDGDLWPVMIRSSMEGTQH